MKFILSLILFVTLFITNAWSDEPSPLRVGVIEAPPYAYLTTNNQFVGLSIETWKAAAKKGHLNYVYVPLGIETDKGVQLLKQNKIDVLLGPLVVTPKRLQAINLSIPYTASSIGVILVKEKPFSFIMEIIKNFFLTSVALIIVLIFLIFFIYVNLFWYFERGKLSSIPVNYWEAMSQAFWLHILRQGFGMPTTNYGRFVAFCWLLLTLFVFSSFNATLTSIFSMLLRNQYENVQTIDNLQDQKIACPANTYFTAIAANTGVDIIPVVSLEQGYQLLEAKKVKGLLYDYHTLNYFLAHQKNKDNYALKNLYFVHYMYAIGIRKHNPQLLNKVNLAIAGIQNNGESLNICRQYILDTSASACIS